MTWRDKLKPASFSGVPFHVRENERGGGRRAAVHTFPMRERPFVQEQGREPRRFSVEGYLIGDDYVEQRELLTAVLEGASPDFPDAAGRVLVLPTFDPLLALATSFRFRETFDGEGRIVRFFAEFVEVGEDPQPASVAGGTGAADDAAANLEESAAVRFEGEVEVEGVVEEARTPIASAVTEATVRVRRLDVFSGPAREVRALEDALTVLETTLFELVTAPADLAGAAQVMVHRVLASAPTPRAALEAYRSLFELDALEVAGSSAQDLAAARNSQATVDLLRTAAIGGAVRAAARVPWETLEDAQEVRAELSGVLDELEATASLEVLDDLAALRAALGQSVPPADQDLPQLRALTLARTLPAIVVAYGLYQDPERGEELVRRNALPNPLRVPGGEVLQVLSR